MGVGETGICEPGVGEMGVVETGTPQNNVFIFQTPS